MSCETKRRWRLASLVSTCSLKRVLAVLERFNGILSLLLVLSGCNLMRSEITDVSDRFPDLIGRCVRVSTTLDLVVNEDTRVSDYAVMHLSRPDAGTIPQGSILTVERIYYEQAIEYSVVWVVARWDGKTIEIGNLMNGEWIDAVREGLLASSDMRNVARHIPLDERYLKPCSPRWW